MKFTFLIFVIVIFWSVHVDCDNTDIYTGVQDEPPFKQDEDYSPLFPDSSYPIPRWRGSFPWTRERKPTKPSNERITDRIIDTLRIRELQEMLERRREQYKVDAEKNFQYQNAYHQILDDPRPYAQEQDSDFSFPNDDVVLEDLDGTFGRQDPPEGYLNREPYNPYNGFVFNGQEIQGNAQDRQDVPLGHFGHEAHGHGGHGMHAGHQGEGGDAVPAGSGVFKDVEFVKDPTDFAYLPTDPRFMDDVKSSGGNNGKEIKEGSNNEVVSEPPVSAAKIDSIGIETANNLMVNKGNNADDYGFLDDDDDDPQPNVKPETDINVIHRNDMGTYIKDGNYNKDFLRNDEGMDVIAVRPQHPDPDSTGIYILAIIAGVSAAALVTLITLVITWFNLQKHVKNASDVEYPAYGVTGPNKEVSPSGDRRLAQSAQMYHYQHQKQQIIAMERAAANERHGSISEADSDEENEEGDYTVYECPGLAPTGEMEVKNPLFQDDPTPAQTPPQQKQNDSNVQKK